MHIGIILIFRTELGSGCICAPLSVSKCNSVIELKLTVTHADAISDKCKTYINKQFLTRMGKKIIQYNLSNELFSLVLFVLLQL
jgi:hypothetical protein